MQFSKLEDERKMRVAREETVRTAEIEQDLEVLGSESATSHEKGRAFVRLIDNGYILSCRMMCEGGSYDDEVQKKKFCEALKGPGYVDALMSVEAKPL